MSLILLCPPRGVGSPPRGGTFTWTAETSGLLQVKEGPSQGRSFRRAAGKDRQRLPTALTQMK